MTHTNTPRIALWTLALALCAGTLVSTAAGAAAGALSPAKAQVEQCPAVSPASPEATSTPAATPALGDLAPDLFTPAPSPTAICPLIGCVDDVYCRRDSDCTAAPNGTCRLFCPKLGCCAYS